MELWLTLELLAKVLLGAHFLEEMISELDKTQTYVLLEKFGGIDTVHKGGKDLYVRDILQNWFSSEANGKAAKVAGEKGM